MTTTIPDLVRGRWVGTLDWQNHWDFAPSLGYDLVLAGRVTSRPHVVERQGLIVVERFTIHVPRLRDTSACVYVEVVWGDDYDERPAWMPHLDIGRSVEVRCCEDDIARLIDAEGTLRDRQKVLGNDVRAFVEEGPQ